jgi:hypothetical protein
MMDREAEIYVLLAQLDLKSIRPLAEGDTVRVAAINTEKEALRQELRSLQDAAANLN